jgi:hypothetical protein
VKLLVVTWLLGVALLLGVFVVPSLGVVLLVGSGLYLISVVIWWVVVVKELNQSVWWVEKHLSTVRYGTVTERNRPIV